MGQLLKIQRRKWEPETISGPPESPWHESFPPLCTVYRLDSKVKVSWKGHKIWKWYSTCSWQTLRPTQILNFWALKRLFYSWSSVVIKIGSKNRTHLIGIKKKKRKEKKKAVM